MLFRDLTQINFIKNNQTSGSDSLIIDLSKDGFFYIFYLHLTKLLEIETVVIGQNHRSWGQSKTN